MSDEAMEAFARSIPMPKFAVEELAEKSGVDSAAAKALELAHAHGGHVDFWRDGESIGITRYSVVAQ